jgi:hypothetical protein
LYEFVAKHFLVLLCAGGLLCAVVIAGFSQRPWQPQRVLDQPIPFSHLVHAGEHHIACQYCHAYARLSDFAGIPPVERCVGCHGPLRWRQIERVYRPWTDNRPSPFEIRWNRVYKLPSFVRFSHRIHIHARVQCQTCHGPVQLMETVEPVNQMNMGFCIDCHTRGHVTRDCFVCHY